MTQQYRISGAIFEVQGGGPAFTGFIEIDGKKEFIALWPKTSAKGQNYFQVAEDKKRVEKEGARSSPSPFKPKPKPSPIKQLPRPGPKRIPNRPPPN